MRNSNGAAVEREGMHKAFAAISGAQWPDVSEDGGKTGGWADTHCSQSIDAETDNGLEWDVLCIARH